jgi:hypothetical protein
MNQNKSVVPENVAGIVTLSEPVMMMDGKMYDCLWARHWREMPVAEEPKEQPKDGEFAYATLVTDQFWGLMGMFGKDKMVFIPGCVVIGWVGCKFMPDKDNIYIVGCGE